MNQKYFDLNLMSAQHHTTAPTVDGKIHGKMKKLTML